MRINFLTCTFVSVLVGISGDNAIQYLYGKRYRNATLLEGINQRGGGSVRIALSMIAATSVFFFSYFQPARTLAMLLCIGLSLNLLGDLWLLKGLLRFGKGRQG